MADWQLEDRTPNKTITGPQGPQGPMGPQGPQGVKGNDGGQGPKGDQGAQGFAGPQGAQGPAGAKGDKGDRGAVGVQGPQGEIGPRGSQGAQGDVGPRGNTGSQGQQGPQGGKGDKGDKGDTGAMGPKGDQGIQGIQGPKGDQGIQGPQGIKGDQGAGVSIKGSRATPNDLPATGNAAGDTYIMTTSGSGFAAGDGYSYTGTQFVNVGQIRGPQGVAGNTGAQGPKGDTGAQGAQGPKGDTGAAGANGADGAQGIQGPKGDKGDTGAQGAQGIQGPKGDTGAQGVQGPQGATGPAPDTSTFARLNGATFVGDLSISTNLIIRGANPNSNFPGLTFQGRDNSGLTSVLYSAGGELSIYASGPNTTSHTFYNSGAIYSAQMGDLKTYIDTKYPKTGGDLTGNVNVRKNTPALYLVNSDGTNSAFDGGYWDFQHYGPDGNLYIQYGYKSGALYNIAYFKPDGSLNTIQLGDLKNYIDQRGTPPGVVADYAGSSAPAGWLKCNGAAVSRSAYAALFAVIGTTYGAGDGNSTFNLPDSRGYFRRSLDDGRGLDSGRALGSTQAQDIGPHTHFVPNVTAVSGSGGTTGLANNQGGGAPLAAVNSGQPTAGGVETRPVNIAFLAIIKY